MLFKKKLTLKTGFDFWYWTRFNTPGYSPVTGGFFNQEYYSHGNYPLVDYFLQFNFKRMQVFVKYAHVSYYLTNTNDYIAISRYPMQKGNFSFGISWYFYN